MIQDVFMQKAEIEQVDTGVKYMSVLCVREEREMDTLFKVGVNTVVPLKESQSSNCI